MRSRPCKTNAKRSKHNSHDLVRPNRSASSKRMEPIQMNVSAAGLLTRLSAQPSRRPRLITMRIPPIARSQSIRHPFNTSDSIQLCSAYTPYMGKKPMEFYEGEEQEKRVDAVMKAILIPTAKAPKQALQEHPQSSGE